MKEVAIYTVDGPMPSAAACPLTEDKLKSVIRGGSLTIDEDRKICEWALSIILLARERGE